MSETAIESAVSAAHAALRSTSMLLPHLAGLAYLVRVAADWRVPTAGVFASGRLVVNPRWFGALTAPERIFVIAHELLHLALRTHERRGDSDPRLFNIAHDYIINDMLRTALTMDVPAGGLDSPGAADRSAEALMADLRKQNGALANAAWDDGSRTLGSLGAALAKALQVERAAGSSESGLDVLDAATERSWFPSEDGGVLVPTRDAMAAAADRAVALGVWRDRANQVFTPPSQAPHAGERRFVEALEARTRPRWELALQRWLEDTAPGPRSYGRPSRRQGDRGDVVLAGRRREGWTLTLVLDTSGSMVSALEQVLGQIKSFCEAAGVRAIRLLQCGEVLEADAIVAVDDLRLVEILGGTGGDLKPGMLKLAQDPDVEAVVVVTDGYEDYPRDPMPYEVLWAITGAVHDFEPGYGRILGGLAALPEELDLTREDE